MHRFLLTAVFLLPLSAANLVQNPGFEQPTLTDTFSIFTAPGAIPSWTWAGPGAGLLLRNDYAEGALLFPAHSGQNSLDMTGPGWTGNNVIYQDISTVIGQLYTLSFWLGNQVDTHPSYSQASSLGLTIGSLPETVYSLSSSAGSSVTWVQFSQSFTAASATTRISFRNTTNSLDNMAGLDDVFVDVAGVPEPATFLPMVLAIGFGLRRWKLSRVS